MIYLDNAATTLVKPGRVSAAVSRAMKSYGSMGRGGHAAAERAFAAVYKCREAAAALFGVDDPERIVFTFNATHALNIAIKSLLKNGGNAVISGYEHNAVLRPLHKLQEKGVRLDTAKFPLFNRQAAIDAFRQLITKQTACVVCTHVSNVFGFILPIIEIDRICANLGVPLIIDAAQSAGVINIDYSAFTSNPYICMPGHKSLYGPQGTGILICPPGQITETLLEGGTGSSSLLADMPDGLPDRLEAGTANVHGLAGLYEGINFVRKIGVDRISRHDRGLIEYAVERFSRINGVHAYSGSPDNISSVLSFTIDGVESELAADALAKHGIAVRAGLHCAPLAHQSAGTLPDGTVRLSVSWFNTRRDIDAIAEAAAKNLKLYVFNRI